MRMRTGMVLGCSVVLVVCVAAIVTMVVSSEALGRTLVSAPAVVVSDFAASGRAAEETRAASDADSPRAVASAPQGTAATTVVTPEGRQRRELSEAELDALDREADRVAGLENADPQPRRAVTAEPVDDGGIPLPVGGIVTWRAEAPVMAPAEQPSEAVSEPVLASEPEAPPSIPTDIFGYVGSYPAVPIVNTPPQPSGPQPFVPVPYQVQPTPGVMRGY